jgi:hypothetical protein
MTGITPRGKSALEDSSERGITIAEWLREERYAKTLHRFHYDGVVNWDDSLEHDAFRREARAVLALVDIEIDTRLAPLYELVYQLRGISDDEEGMSRIPWSKDLPTVRRAAAVLIEGALTDGERAAR